MTDAPSLDTPLPADASAAQAEADRIRSIAFASGSNHPYMNAVDPQHTAWMDRIGQLDAIAAGLAPPAGSPLAAAQAKLVQAQSNPALAAPDNPAHKDAKAALDAAGRELAAAEAAANPFEAAMQPPSSGYDTSGIPFDLEPEDPMYGPMFEAIGPEGTVQKWLRDAGASQGEANTIFMALREILPRIDRGAVDVNWLAQTRTSLERQYGDTFADKVSEALDYVARTAGEDAVEFLIHSGLGGHGLVLLTLMGLSERRSQKGAPR